jgi:hypothetical protein
VWVLLPEQFRLVGDLRANLQGGLTVPKTEYGGAIQIQSAQRIHKQYVVNPHGFFSQGFFPSDDGFLTFVVFLVLPQKKDYEGFFFFCFYFIRQENAKKLGVLKKTFEVFFVVRQ